MNSKIIAITNKKGGIGKSSTALALSASLQNKGNKVLMIDTDPQRNTTNVYHAQTENTPTLYDIFFDKDFDPNKCIQSTDYGDIIASDENLSDADTQIKQTPLMYSYIKNAIEQLNTEYDYIIIDTPPHAGVLLGNVLIASHYLIIPVTCDSFGIQGIVDFNELINIYKQANTNLKIAGMLIIKYKGRQNLTRSVEDNVLPDLAKTMQTTVFNTKIRECVKCQEAQTMRQSIFDYAPECTTALDYTQFTEELLNRINERD